jgi:phosphocarrier protein HPr
MTEREITVTNSLGIHARPASLIVKAASRFISDITIVKDDMVADAKSIMNIMMLTVTKDSKILLTANGPDEEDAITTIAGMFENKFDEE